MTVSQLSINRYKPIAIAVIAIKIGLAIISMLNSLTTLITVIKALNIETKIGITPAITLKATKPATITLSTGTKKPKFSVHHLITPPTVDSTLLTTFIPSVRFVLIVSLFSVITCAIQVKAPLNVLNIS